MTYAWPQIDEVALRDYRWSQVSGLLRERRLDHLLLMGADNIRYVTDYRTQLIAEGFDWFAAIVDSEGQSDVFVPWVDEEQKEPAPDVPGVRTAHPMPSWAPAAAHPRSWSEGLSRVLQRGSAKRVGYEVTNPELADRLREELPDVEFVPVAADLFDLRRWKHPTEVVLLEAASVVNAQAAEAAIAAAKPGMTDYDVLAVAMASLQSAGVEYLTHSLCNHRRGSGTWFAMGSKLREGDAFFFDIGCYGKGGYASDIARTGFVGEPPEEVQAAYNTLLEAHRVGQETAKAGVRVSEVDAAINNYLARQRMPHTPYGLGHGVGLRACELPTIYRPDRMDRDEILDEGNVISLEPETGVEVHGELVLLKTEDNFVVESDGLRLLSDAQHAE